MPICHLQALPDLGLRGFGDLGGSGDLVDLGGWGISGV